MKIETIVPLQKNTTVKFSNNIRATFVNGVATVSEDIGDYLLSSYPTQIFPEGKVVIPEVVKPVANKTAVDGSEAELLKEKLQRANLLLNDYKAQVGQAKENERVWRTKCQDLMMENHLLRDQLGKPRSEDIKVDVKIDEEKANDETTAEATSLKTALEEKTIKELTIIAEEMKLPAEEYKLLNKKKLVDFIIAKTNVTT
jgi:hypothetical protein